MIFEIGDLVRVQNFFNGYNPEESWVEGVVYDNNDWSRGSQALLVSVTEVSDEYAGTIGLTVVVPLKINNDFKGRITKRKRSYDSRKTV